MTDHSAAAAASNRRIMVIACVGAIGGLLFGFDTGIISGAIVQLRRDWRLDPLTEGAIVSGVLWGGLVGAAFGGKACDAFGRGATISATAAIFVVGSFWTGLAGRLACLAYRRPVLGRHRRRQRFGRGAALPVGNRTSEIRGAVVTLNQLALVAGVLCSYTVSARYATAADGWRYMLMAGAAPAVVLGYAMLFLPASPRWLMSNGREGSARRMLRRLSVANEDVAIAEVKKSLEATTATSWRELLQPAFRLPLLIGVGLMFFQQLSGVGIDQLRDDRVRHDRNSRPPAPRCLPSAWALPTSWRPLRRSSCGSFRAQANLPDRHRRHGGLPYCPRDGLCRTEPARYVRSLGRRLQPIHLHGGILAQPRPSQRFDRV